MKWIRLIPRTTKRPTPERYTLSSPNGGFRYEQGLLYEVNEDIARYLCKPGLIDGDPSSLPVFESFETEAQAKAKVAEERGMVPAMLNNESMVKDESDVKPLDPTASRSVRPPSAPTKRDLDANATASAARRKRT